MFTTVGLDRLQIFGSVEVPKHAINVLFDCDCVSVMLLQVYSGSVQCFPPSTLHNMTVMGQEIRSKATRMPFLFPLLHGSS